MATVPKFKHDACRLCGTPRSVLNPAWLRQRRVASGLTLREMARQLGYSAPYVSDIEHGRRNCLPRVRAAYERLEPLS